MAKKRRKSPLIIIILVLFYGAYSYFDLDRYIPLNDTLSAVLDTSFGNQSVSQGAAQQRDSTPQETLSMENSSAISEAGTSADSSVNPSANSAVDDDLLHFATWNVRILSDNSRDDEELKLIAGIMDNYEFIAVQELRDTKVLDRLMAMLPESYTYIASDPVGRGVKELYAYIYNSQVVSHSDSSYLYDDSKDIFIREPYIADFQAGEFDFTVITMHSIYGDSISDRRMEASYMDSVILEADSRDPDEKDIILTGDFNLPGDDHAWDIIGYTALVSPEQKTTITDTSSYDNIWLSEEHTYSSEFHSFDTVYRFDEELFNDDDKAASLAVSDHRPVSLFFRTNMDDD
ncbi:MAG: endonuclease/exonuclease/phosphatase family protein [Spirochaetia bacterium]|nr:endonuclease/exonuclease/phosphatase family protein [Spirochaetia bacterium]